MVVSIRWCVRTCHRMHFTFEVRWFETVYAAKWQFKCSTENHSHTKLNCIWILISWMCVHGFRNYLHSRIFCFCFCFRIEIRIRHENKNIQFMKKFVVFVVVFFVRRSFFLRLIRFWLSISFGCMQCQGLRFIKSFSIDFTFFFFSRCKNPQTKLIHFVSVFRD